MIDSRTDCELKPGQAIDLLDEMRTKIGSASVVRFLPSHNPVLHAIEVSIAGALPKVKAVKFVTPRS